MSVDRREFLKLGAVGTLGIAGLTVPVGAAVSTAVGSALAPANFPAQYRYPFVRPPVLKPYEWGFDEEGKFERYNLNQQIGTASIVPGLMTTRPKFVSGLWRRVASAVWRPAPVMLTMIAELEPPSPLMGSDDCSAVTTRGALSGSARTKTSRSPVARGRPF